MRICLRKRKQVGRFSFFIPTYRTLPRSWSEVSRDQALRFAFCLIESGQPFDKPYSEQFRLMVVNAWLKMEKADFAELTEPQMIAIVSELKDIFDSPPLTLNLRKLIKGYSGPLPLLSFESVGGWEILETWYQQIIQREDDRQQSLHMFLSYLMRDPVEMPDDQAAEKFRANTSEGYELHMFLVYWWYYHTRQALAEKYKAAFSSSGKKKAVDYTSQYGWSGLIYQIASEGVFGSVEQLRRIELHRFLDYLSFNSDRYKELEWEQRMQTT
jgi:hypothetical protein